MVKDDTVHTIWMRSFFPWQNCKNRVVTEWLEGGEEDRTNKRFVRGRHVWIRGQSVTPCLLAKNYHPLKPLITLFRFVTHFFVFLRIAWNNPLRNFLFNNVFHVPLSPIPFLCHTREGEIEIERERERERAREGLWRDFSSFILTFYLFSFRLCLV